MLIKFNFENFKSFKNENCLDMEATSLKEHEYNLINLNNNKYLKIAAIYGANASGKTNVLEAFEYMKNNLILSNGVRSNNFYGDNYSFSFNSKTKNEPIGLEVVIVAENKEIYKYGYKIKENMIISEWLYIKTVNKFTSIFEREGTKISFSKSYDVKIKEHNVDDSTLFLSLYNKLDIKNDDFSNVILWFRKANFLDLGNPNFEYNRFNTALPFIIDTDFKEYKKGLLSFMRVADLGITDFIFKEKKNSNDEKYLEKFTVHKNEEGEDVILSLSSESKGTFKMFHLYTYIIMALKYGFVLFIDELDAKLHPLLTRYIINLFHDSSKNIGNGQLIYSTHDTVNLNKDTFRRDEIWFAEKDKSGVSELYSLSEYKIDNAKIRNDATYNKDYLTGRYGAIPVFEEFKII